MGEDGAHLTRRWRRCRRGAAAVEFALIGPLLVVLLMGIVAYGGYFWVGHTVQQLANDSARAAIAGLDDAEREMLVRDCIETQLPRHGAFDPERTDIDIARTGNFLTVEVSYDATGSIFWAFERLLPMPSPVVERSATIRLGGY